jgi:hypothetical protein
MLESWPATRAVPSFDSHTLDLQYLIVAIATGDDPYKGQWTTGNAERIGARRTMGGSAYLYSVDSYSNDGNSHALPWRPMLI